MHSGGASFGPESLLYGLVMQHGGDKVNQSPFESLGDPALLRDLGNSQLMLDAVFLEICLELVRNVFSTAIASECSHGRCSTGIGNQQFLHRVAGVSHGVLVAFLETFECFGFRFIG